MADGYWDHFPHSGDIGVRGRGATKEDAFVAAAQALTAAITDLDAVGANEAVEISCSAPDDEVLLVDWLNALIFEMDVRGMLFSDFRVRINENSLKATALGEPVDSLRHAPAVEAKGATFSELKVRRERGGEWVAQCVVDV